MRAPASTDHYTRNTNVQACIDAGGAALVNLEDPRHSTMQPLAPLMANETAIAWVGAVYIHAGTTQESVSSSRPSNGWMWVTAVDQAGQGAPDEHQSSLQVVQRLPWAPGFPRLLGKDHVNLQSTGQIKSCVAMRWVPRWGPVFQNLDCSSQVPRYLVCLPDHHRQNTSSTARPACPPASHCPLHTSYHASCVCMPPAVALSHPAREFLDVSQLQ